ncbi:hypothetical protein ScPMuIL_003378 [Solemya velum]
MSEIQTQTELNGETGNPIIRVSANKIEIRPPRNCKVVIIPQTDDRHISQCETSLEIHKEQVNTEHCQVKKLLE